MSLDLKILLTFILCLHVINAEEGRIQVRLSGGLVEGRVVKFGDREALAFMGVPFAEPPIGDLRFKPTLLKSSWPGVWDATHYGPPCAQRTLTTIQPLTNSSEDCLHVNVYADPRCLNKSCPIFFYVHGGGFYFDAPTMFNDTLLLENFAIHETIFVMPAYRLGIFGFLDMGPDDLDAPQNAGLLDLVAALRWTQLEIPRLGGDIRRMTVIGNSAGAHLAYILANSPLVEVGAFQSAIISSGMVGIREGECRTLTEEVLEQAGCTHNSTHSTFTRQQKIDCLRSKSTDELLDAMSDSESRWHEFVPRPDGRVLVHKTVDEFLENWRGIPMLIVTTEDESLYRDRPTVESKCERLVYDYGYSSPQAFDACVHYYTHESDLNYVFRDAFHAFMHRIAAINTQKGYETFAAIFAQDNGKRHAEDLIYLLGLHPLEKKDKNDLLMDKYYPEIIRQYVKYGSRGMGDWQPVDSLGRNYYWMRYKADENSTRLLDWPHMKNGDFFRPKQTDFWMQELRRINNGLEDESDEEDYNHIEEPPIPPLPEPHAPSVWIAFWIMLGVCVFLSAALSTITIFWLTVRLRASGLIVPKVIDNGQV